MLPSTTLTAVVVVNTPHPSLLYVVATVPVARHVVSAHHTAWKLARPTALPHIDASDDTIPGSFVPALHANIRHFCDYDDGGGGS